MCKTLKKCKTLKSAVKLKIKIRNPFKIANRKIKTIEIKCINNINYVKIGVRQHLGCVHCKFMSFNMKRPSRPSLRTINTRLPGQPKIAHRILKIFSKMRHWKIKPIQITGGLILGS